MHFDATDKIDRVIMYLDRAPINEATKQQVLGQRSTVHSQKQSTVDSPQSTHEPAISEKIFKFESWAVDRGLWTVSHDPKSKVYCKDLFVKVLPD